MHFSNKIHSRGLVKRWLFFRNCRNKYTGRLMPRVIIYETSSVLITYTQGFVVSIWRPSLTFTSFVTRTPFHLARLHADPCRQSTRAKPFRVRVDASRKRISSVWFDVNKSIPFEALHLPSLSRDPCMRQD